MASFLNLILFISNLAFHSGFEVDMHRLENNEIQNTRQF